MRVVWATVWLGLVIAAPLAVPAAEDPKAVRALTARGGGSAPVVAVIVGAHFLTL
jgi:hypothetical protein